MSGEPPVDPEAVARAFEAIDPIVLNALRVRALHRAFGYRVEPFSDDVLRRAAASGLTLPPEPEDVAATMATIRAGAGLEPPPLPDKES
jgi:hypothetical protein